MRCVAGRLLAAVLALCGAFSLSFVSSATAQSTSLEGLRGVYVLVEPVPTALERDGLYRSAITATAERALTEAGIPVLSADAVQADARQPHLCITVTSALTGSGLHAYHLSTTFRQAVGLVHAPDTHVLATTWAAPPVTGAVAGEQVEWLDEEIDAMLRQFVAAYHSANPPAAE